MLAPTGAVQTWSCMLIGRQSVCKSRVLSSCTKVFKNVAQVIKLQLNIHSNNNSLKCEITIEVKKSPNRTIMSLLNIILVKVHWIDVRIWTSRLQNHYLSYPSKSVERPSVYLTSSVKNPGANSGGWFLSFSFVRTKPLYASDGTEPFRRGVCLQTGESSIKRELFRRINSMALTFTTVKLRHLFRPFSFSFFVYLPYLSTH